MVHYILGIPELYFHYESSCKFRPQSLKKLGPYENSPCTDGFFFSLINREDHNNFNLFK